ncbi:Y-family DNA polymerase [Methylococcus geothermalis]|uniref:DNA polymerase Y family protein n=1 Tax=Methylococcus geothermalis TaxID=2681310 RepID=A0A858Q760_9GAMM|nr:DNA polymerase Y family protein [Methylococcus geothermalis]QJD29657.1 DNA polymerase Y family protein [Methylococcus geothermalis]
MALARAYHFPSLPAEPPCEDSAAVAAPLWLALHFPALALEALGAAAPEPLAVTDAAGGRLRVHGASAAAAAQGVVPGMVLAEAQALCPKLAPVNRDPEAERRALSRLAERCLRFTPWISLDFPATLQLEVRGSLRLFGGAEALAEKVRQACAADGHAVQCGLAPTPAAAWLLARAGCPAPVLEAGALRSVLGDLPIAALGIDDKLTGRLARAGLRVLRDLWRMPRDGLARRYGRDLLRRLDEAAGSRPQPLRQFHAPPRFRAERELAMETEDLTRVFPLVEALLAEFEAFLRSRDAVAAGLELELRHARAAPTRVCLGLRRAGREAGQFAALLRERLDRLALPGPVRGMLLRSAGLQPFTLPRTDLFTPETAGGEGWDELLDRLQARLGPQALRQPVLRADHRPERTESGNASRSGETARSPRPLWLLPRPRLLSRRDIRILPECERIETGWWDGGPVRRDYHVAVDGAGARLWIYRDTGTAGPWHWHGLFG